MTVKTSISHPVLVICGPTAMGKTNLAVSLAQQYSTHILACDSRQIYQEMSIGTGKDIPSNAVKEVISVKGWGNTKVYSTANYSIFGYDIIKPGQKYSAIDYYHYAWPVIKFIWSEQKLPIIVGGTGQYLKYLFTPPDTAGIAPNFTLRHLLNQKTLKSLQAQLQTISPSKWEKMNSSDQKNPHRLIRAIEVSRATSSNITKSNHSPANTLFIGLTSTSKSLKQAIKKRVNDRANSHFTQELKNLLEKYPHFFKSEAATAIGYRQWHEYVNGRRSLDSTLTEWVNQEYQYAKRQLTWFKKQPEIVWFDVDQPDFQEQIVLTIKNWYATTNA